MLERRGDAPFAQADGEGGSEAAGERGVGSVGPAEAACPAPRPAEVHDRREVHVHPDVAQARAGRPTLAPGQRGVAGAAERRGRAGRRAGQALHQAALLVDHHEQRRIAESTRPADGLEATELAAQRRPGADVPREEDDAADLAPGHRAGDGRRDAEAVVADDHALTRELAAGEAGERIGRPGRPGGRRRAGRGAAAGRGDGEDGGGEGGAQVGEVRGHGGGE